MGGADQITKSDHRLVGHAVEAKILARRRAGRHLAQRRRFRRSRDEPDAVLAAIDPKLAENLGGRDGIWCQSGQTAGRRRGPPLISRVNRGLRATGGDRRTYRAGPSTHGSPRPTYLRSNRHDLLAGRGLAPPPFKTRLRTHPL